MEANKEIQKQMLLNIAIVSGGGKKEWVDALSPHWNTYISLELGLDTEVEIQKEEIEKLNLLETYSRVKATKVTAKRSRTNPKQLIVEGLKDLEKF